MSRPLVRPLLPHDWPSVEAVYRAGIATGHATFEADPPTWKGFDSGKSPDLRFVAVVGGRVVGWAAAGPTSSRAAYRGVVEHSVYVDPAARASGVGSALLERLCHAADELGYWTIQSSVFPENAASLRLHERHGFRRVGTRERIALMTYGPLEGRWRDTVLIERRSPSHRQSFTAGQTTMEAMENVAVSNPVVHAEITGSDPAGLQAFYGALFGWAAAPGDPVAAAVSAPDAYAFNPPDRSSGAVPIGIGGGPGFGPRVTFYVGVADVAVHLARAVELGATVVLDTALRPDGRARVAQFADPQGNIVGLAAPA